MHCVLPPAAVDLHAVDLLDLHRAEPDFFPCLLESAAQGGRARDIPAAIAAFNILYARHTGVVAAEVVSAAPLGAAQLKAVKAGLREALGKDPELTARVDPSLLGGLKVKVGSRLFDASLKTRLDQMKFALKRA